MRIYVYGATCPECEKTFFEMDGEEHDNCPHCGSGTQGAASGPKQVIDIVVDPITGQVEVNE